jgi:hypothetical protein
MLRKGIYIGPKDWKAKWLINFGAIKSKGLKIYFMKLKRKTSVVFATIIVPGVELCAIYTLTSAWYAQDHGTV